jgi:hypothetical protein
LRRKVGEAVKNSTKPRGFLLNAPAPGAGGRSSAGRGGHEPSSNGKAARVGPDDTPYNVPCEGPDGKPYMRRLLEKDEGVWCYDRPPPAEPNFGTVNYDHGGQAPNIHWESPSGFENDKDVSWYDLKPHGGIPLVEGDWGEPFTLDAVGSKEFAAKEFTREWLIKKLAVAGQPLLVGGPRKSLKTSLMVATVVALGSAMKFLGMFDVPRKFKVLLLSGESLDATIQETAERICQAMGIRLEDLEGYVWWGFRLPSLDKDDHMRALAEFIKENGIEIVIIDPLYLCMLSGNSRLNPANLFDVGPLLAKVTEICLDAGSTPALVHHLRKNREAPHEPPELEDLAFAGVQEFARQWLLIGRRESYEPGTGEHHLWLNAGGACGHGGTWAVDVSEGVMDDDFGGRHWQVEVRSASSVRLEEDQQDRATQAERKTAKERDRERSLYEDEIKVFEALQKAGGKACKSKIYGLAGMPAARGNGALERLETAGRIVRGPVTVPKGKGQTEEMGWWLADPKA